MLKEIKRNGSVFKLKP